MTDYPEKNLQTAVINVRENLKQNFNTLNKEKDKKEANANSGDKKHEKFTKKHQLQTKKHRRKDYGLQDMTAGISKESKKRN